LLFLSLVPIARRSFRRHAGVYNIEQAFAARLGRPSIYSHSSLKRVANALRLQAKVARRFQVRVLTDDPRRENIIPRSTTSTSISTPAWDGSP